MALWYLVLLNVEGRRCVVFGGGAVGERKAAGLLEAGAEVTVVSPDRTPRLERWRQEGRIRAVLREAEDSDLDGAFLAFAATDKPDVNRRLAAAARARGVPILIADEGEAGDFINPAVVRRGDLVLAVSASGAAPALASRIRRELEERYGPEYGKAAEILEAIRLALKRAGVGDAERRRLLAAAASPEAMALWREAEDPADGDRLLARLQESLPDIEGPAGQ
jgi:precorrin-2 dehydrogenase/sirohydrochlorin ferrochelatase